MIEQPICTKEAAKVLGVHVTTLFRMIKREEVPAHRIGRNRYFFKSELIAQIKKS
jgi:excisionase family DNA binding protein